MRRRDVLKLAAFSAGALASARSQASPLSGESVPSQATPPKLDAHIHLFDTSRPGGVPWPEKTDTALYKPALPDRYTALSAPFGIVGAIAVEASPLAADNDWLLGIAEKNPVIVGIVGDLIPGTETYRDQLERLRENPLFRGFRYGNLWNRDLAADLNKPGFVAGLKELAQADLVFETANPNARLIHAIVEVSERIPGLRIVVDHLPNAQVPTESEAMQAYWADLHRLAEGSRIFVKLSEIPVVQNGQLITDVAFYRDRVDALWNLFGEDRILFGSDWPNSNHVAPYAATLRIVEQYIAQKPPEAAVKYYARNSIAAYKWRARTPAQAAV
jgi:predicted TIM-barrel fold metal-dependent hydrolase